MSTLTANDRQVDGTHYNKRPYQHWDFVCDTNLHYLLGCATKYISRWRDKNGVRDLHKSAHYIEKADEISVVQLRNPFYISLAHNFCEQLNPEDAHIFMLIVNGSYAEAITQINQMIIDLEQEEETLFQQEIIEARKRDGV